MWSTGWDEFRRAADDAALGIICAPLWAGNILALGRYSPGADFFWLTFLQLAGMSMSVRIEVPKDRIAEFCRRWQVKELAIFGSALGDDFRPDSDVDVLVVFQDNAKWDLFDHMKAEEDLKQIFGRDVDLVEKKAIRNPFRRHHILSNYEVIYAA
jgi:uncharacterized protein